MLSSTENLFESPTAAEGTDSSPKHGLWLEVLLGYSSAVGLAVSQLDSCDPQWTEPLFRL